MNSAILAEAKIEELQTRLNAALAENKKLGELIRILYDICMVYVPKEIFEPLEKAHIEIRID